MAWGDSREGVWVGGWGGGNTPPHPPPAQTHAAKQAKRMDDWLHSVCSDWPSRPRCDKLKSWGERGVSGGGLPLYCCNSECFSPFSCWGKAGGLQLCFSSKVDKRKEKWDKWPLLMHFLFLNAVIGSKQSLPSEATHLFHANFLISCFTSVTLSLLQRDGLKRVWGELQFRRRV